MREIVSAAFRVVAITFCCMILVGGAVSAQEREEPHGPATHEGEVEEDFELPGPRGGRIMGLVLGELDLTEAQKSEIQVIVSGWRETGRALRQSLRDNRQALRSMIKEGAYDGNEARSIADQQGDLIAELIFERTQMIASVREVLTPEQRAQAEEMIQLLMKSRRGMRR